MSELTRRSATAATGAVGALAALGVEAAFVANGIPGQGAIAAAMTGAAASEVADYLRGRASDLLWRVRRLGDQIELAYDGVAAEFLAEVNGREETRELFQRVIEACKSTADETKIDWLARVLVAGVAGDAKVEDSMVIVKKIAQLDGPHVRVLSEMIERGHLEITYPRGLPYEPGENYGFEEMLPPLLADLQSLGIVQEGGGNNFPGHWIVTRFGRLCVEYLQDRLQMDER